MKRSLVLSFVVLCWPVFALAQAKPNPKPVSGISVGAIKNGTPPTVHLVNTYTQPITAFTLDVTITNADGSNDTYQGVTDFGPLQQERALAAGAGMDEPLHTGSLPPGATVSIVPVVAIYGDQTGDATDDDAFMDIVNSRTGMAAGWQTTANILDQTLKTDPSPDPSATALKLFDNALLATKLAGHNRNESTFLKSERDEVAKAATTAANDNISVRVYLEERKTLSQQHADLESAFAQIRRLP